MYSPLICFGSDHSLEQPDSNKISCRSNDPAAREMEQQHWSPPLLLLSCIHMTMCGVVHPDCIGMADVSSEFISGYLLPLNRRF